MFQGILVVASAHLEVLTQELISQESLFYESEIARVVNERLGRGNLALNDSTIVAVTLLAASESIRGNTEKLLIHVDALEKLVALRGGIEKLGFNGLLQMTISWVDLTTGAMVSSPPRWPHIKCTNTISRELFASMRAALRITTNNPQAEVVFLTQKDFPTIFNNLKMLSVMLGAAREIKKANFSSVFYFCSMRFFLEHCLLSLPASSVELCSEGGISELSRLTSLIYLHRVLREFQPQVGVLVKLKRKVINLCQRIDDFAGCTHRDSLLWVLVCSGTCWVDEGERTFFAERIAILATHMILESWEDIERVLLGFLWIKGMCRDKTEALWREVEMFMSAAPWMEVLGF